MKSYQQARFDKYKSVVEKIKQAKPYQLSSIARQLEMSELELCSFASGLNIPLLADLIEIENKLRREQSGTWLKDSNVNGGKRQGGK